MTPHRLMPRSQWPLSCVLWLHVILKEDRSGSTPNWGFIAVSFNNNPIKGISDFAYIHMISSIFDRWHWSKLILNSNVMKFLLSVTSNPLSDHFENVLGAWQWYCRLVAQSVTNHYLLNCYSWIQSLYAVIYLLTLINIYIYISVRLC